MNAQPEVADIIAAHGNDFLQKRPQPAQVIKTLKALRDCRTAAMGGRKEKCGSCGHERYLYNSCRNRHCPKCQVINRERWISDRESELLPVAYFHIVFTLPSELNSYALRYPHEVYNSLFKAAGATLKQFAQNEHPGLQTGMSAVLHTWGQNLSLHPHLHCIVPGGGLTSEGKWKQAKNKGKYLYSTEALAQVFRAKFISRLRKAGVKIRQRDAKRLFEKKWVVYAKRPFLGSRQVVEYLGRYTHKIAVSNSRIKKIERDGQVHFTWKNYRRGGRKQMMQLSAIEFLRRFCQHILPSGFMRIRHYGILASRNKAEKLNIAREYFGMHPWKACEKTDWKQIAEKRLHFIPDQCPNCKEGVMETIEVSAPERAPPFIKLKPNHKFHAA